MTRGPFGKTGTFPRGKIHATDEGAVTFGVAHTKSEVIVNFGTPVAWFGLEPDLAEQFGKTLIEHAKAIRAGAQ